MNCLQNHGRIAVMENMEVLTRVETLCLRWNMISKIQNVATLTSLTELDLYDNQARLVGSFSGVYNCSFLMISTTLRSISH